MRAVTESRHGGPGGRGAARQSLAIPRRSGRMAKVMDGGRGCPCQKAEDGGDCGGNAAYWTGRTGTFKKWGSSFEKA